MKTCKHNGEQRYSMPRDGERTTHWDADGYWTGDRGAVFSALASGESFRGGGMQIIGHAKTATGAYRVARKFCKQSGFES